MIDKTKDDLLLREMIKSSCATRIDTIDTTPTSISLDDVKYFLEIYAWPR